MKIKEKLAEEWFETRWKSDTLNWVEQHRFAELCFVAGFEKAREMAAEEANQNAIDIDYEGDLSCRERESKELDTQYNMACYEIALNIKNLGEEEVE